TNQQVNVGALAEAVGAQEGDLVPAAAVAVGAEGSTRNGVVVLQLVVVVSQAGVGLRVELVTSANGKEVALDVCLTGNFGLAMTVHGGQLDATEVSASTNTDVV